MGYGVDLYPQIDTVEQRPGQSLQMASAGLRQALALVRRQRARARVGGEHELESGGVAHRAATSVQHHRPRLERLAQRVERARREFVGLVEEQHPAVRDRHGAGPGEVGTATDQRGDRRGVVRRLQRRPADEACAVPEQAGDRMDRRDFERLGIGQRRQQPGHALREHGLARPRHAEQEDVVPARRRDLDRTFGQLLPGDVGEVGLGAGIGGRRGGLGEFERRPVPGQPRHDLAEVLGGADVDAVDQCRLGGVACCDDDAPHPGGAGGENRREHSARRAQAPVQAELGEPDRRADSGGRHRAGRAQDREAHREVEPRADLADVGREQGHRDASVRPVGAGVLHGGAQPVTRLRHRGVGQAGEVQARQAGGDVALDLDQLAVEPGERDRQCARERHQNAPRRCSTRTPVPRPRTTATTSKRTVANGPSASRCSSIQRSASRRMRAALRRSTASAGVP